MGKRSKAATPPLCSQESCSSWSVVCLDILRTTTYLVWVSVEVKILQETSSKFTEQEVVCVINGPQTPVGVIVGTGACTEWTH